MVRLAQEAPDQVVRDLRGIFPFRIGADEDAVRPPVLLEALKVVSRVILEQVLVEKQDFRAVSDVRAERVEMVDDPPGDSPVLERSKDVEVRIGA
ncbi:hypothetical protein D3C87_1004490 [compost metagenome]